jgi:nitrite reductase/ring-hydroxylating ferredoxin subunit
MFVSTTPPVDPDRPHWVSGIAENELQVNEPVRIVEAQAWLVKLESGEILALWQRDPHLGCSVPFRPEFEFMGGTGWFRNPCHGETYDLTGVCYAGPCPRGLDRFQTRIVNGEVEIHAGEDAAIPGPPLETRAGRDPVLP